MEGALAPYIEEHPVALAIIILSPNSWVRSLIYGVSPQPGHAPWNSKRGVLNWLPFRVYLSITPSFSLMVTAYSEFSNSFSIRSSAGFMIRALVLAGHTSAQLPQPTQSIGNSWIR